MDTGNLTNRRDSAFEPYRLALLETGSILSRHLFVFVNAVIFSVVVLLFIFSDIRSATFLGIIVFINVFLGVAQDFRARVELEKLQLLTAVRFTRVSKDNREEAVFPDEIKINDCILLKLGDQIPCDGVITVSNSLEISEALLTGESDSLSKKVGESVLAGGIVTAGTGTVCIKTLYAESRIAKMTASSKRYSANPSPIQQSIDKIIKYSGYILATVLLFVAGRGYIMHESVALIVKNAGALASIIVPQGLIVTTTLFFAFGATIYSRQKVLFQDINATEKLGRIKNLCMDKTGTLTENFLTVEEMYVPVSVKKETAQALTLLHIKALGVVSQTVVAVEKYLISEGVTETKPEVVNILPFSSWRQYGAATIKGDNGPEMIILGAPDVLLQSLSSEEEKKWLVDLIEKYTLQGKRILAVFHSPGADVETAFSKKTFSLISAFVFKSDFREGIQNTIKFFQDRGVRIRVISGDNLNTVRTVSAMAGVLHTDKAITGAEMKDWSDEDFAGKANSYSIFARVLPEQKVRLVEAFKKDGFTAMVGDGANDALAIKVANLGIAMFDGAKATRQLAGVILMNNSFAALPGAVELADNFIDNIEIFSTTFLNQSFLGLFFFAIISAFGFVLPLTPLNITLINYFSVGLPGMLVAYWAIRPVGIIHPASKKDFLKRVVPLAFWFGLIEAIGVAVVFYFSPLYFKTSETNILVLLAFIVFGFIFFTLGLSARRKIMTGMQKLQVLGLLIVEVLLGIFISRSVFLVDFFNINYSYPSLMDMEKFSLTIIVFGVVLYIFKKMFFTPVLWLSNKTQLVVE